MTPFTIIFPIPLSFSSPGSRSFGGRNGGIRGRVAVLGDEQRYWGDATTNVKK